MSSPDTPGSPRVGGRYRLIERIARGAMGEVHAAYDEHEQRDVALKRMRPEVTGDASAVESFRAEYRALRALEHPRIIEVYHYGIDGGTPYFTMELLDGQDLRRLAPMPPKEACQYLRDVASSIALLHARRLLHRDLSPRNVRRTSDGRCKLIDFGTMIAFGQAPNVAGTPPLVAPEAMAGVPLDQHADLFSLGALAYWLLTGKHAFDVRELNELPAAWKKNPRRMRKIDDAIPEALDDVVLSLLQVDPAGRPSSAGEVIELLTAIGGLQADTSPEVAESYLTRTALVGRSAQRMKLERRVARATAGRGCAIKIHAAAGGGKTRLLQDVEVVAQTHGLSTVYVSAREFPGDRGVVAALGRALVAAAPLGAQAAMGEDRRQIETFIRAPGRIQSMAGLPSTGAERRAAMQSKLFDWFTSVAREQPVLVAIDDLDAADEFSLAFVAALAIEARQVGMCLLATSSRDEDEVGLAGFRAFSEIAQRMTLEALDEVQTTELVASSFGPVPNVERVASWVFRNAHGNPAMSIELIRHLAEREVVRYLGSIWVLPVGIIDEEAPQELRKALALRLRRLGPEARGVLELVATRGLSATRSLVASASGLAAEATAAALDELVDRELLMRTEERYTFKLEAQRDAVLMRIDRHSSRELHARLAAAFLAGDSGEEADDGDGLPLAARVAAGWHLSHTAQELKGARILAREGVHMLTTGFSPPAAAAAMERALEILQRHDQSLVDELRLRSQLTQAGFLCDRRLAVRYGEGCVHDLFEMTGLARAARWGRFVGAAPSVYASLALLTLTRLFKRRHNRPPGPVRGLVFFCRALASLSGVRALAFDAPGTAALAAMARVLARARVPGAEEAALACIAFGLQPLGRQAELCAALDEAIECGERGERRITPHVLKRDREELRAGLLLARGVNEAFLPGTGSLRIADEIETMGSNLAGVYAERVRMVHHSVRGHREQVDRSRRLIELHAIQGGTTWQVTAFALPIDGLAGALYGDVVACRRALDQIDELIEDMPSMSSMRNMVRVNYHHVRGEHGTAVEHGEAFVRAHPPGSLIGWPFCYASTAASHIELGNHARAVELMRGAWDAVSEADRRYVLMYLPLKAMLAVAEGSAGDVARAGVLFGEIDAELATHDEHEFATLIHGYRLRLARLNGDEAGVVDALAAMREGALRSGNPALIANVTRIIGLRRRDTAQVTLPQSQRGTGATYPTLPGGRMDREASDVSAADPVGDSEPGDPPGDVSVTANHTTETAVWSRSGGKPDEASQDDSLIAQVLDASSGAETRAQQALQIMAQAVGSTSGYLMVDIVGDPTVAGRLTLRDPPEALETRMEEAIVRPVGSQQRVWIGDPASPGNSARPTGGKTYLLVPLGMGESGRCSAVAALEVADDELVRLPGEVLEQVRRALERDFAANRT